MAIRIPESKNIYLWLAKRYTEHKITSHSGQVAFFMLLSFFPTIMLLLKIASQLPIMDTDSILSAFDSMGPGTIGDVLESTFNDVIKPSGGVYVFTIISLIWAGSKGFDGLAFGFDSIYSSDNKRGFFLRRSFALLYLIGFVFLILTNFVLITFGKDILDFLHSNLELPLNGFLIHGVLRYALLLAIVITFFVLLFRFVPYTPAETMEEKRERLNKNKSLPRKERIRRPKNRTWKQELPGAIVSSALWIIFTRLFSIYVKYRLNHPSYYGSLASVFLSLLWLYFCIMFIFIGALYNNYGYETGESATRHLVRDLPDFFKWIKATVFKKSKPVKNG